MKSVINVFIVVFLFISCTSLSIGQNIALGKKYNFSVKPNYSLTNGGDETNLTDGDKRMGMRFWQEKTSVGWNYVDEVNIDLDLEGVYRIDKVLINTVRGKKSGVQFPLNCLVFASMDNNKFEFLGDLMLSDRNHAGEYKVEEFMLNEIETKARYLKFVLSANGRFIFLDEIEVYGTKTNNTSKKNIDLIKQSELESFIKTLKKKSSVSSANQKRINSVKDYIGDNSISVENSNINDAIKTAQNKMLPKGIVFTPIISLDILNTFKLKDAVLNQKTGINKYDLEQETKLHYFSLINNSSQSESISFQNLNKINYKIYEILPVVTHNKLIVRDALIPIMSDEIELGANENKFFVFEIVQKSTNEGKVQILNSKNKQLISELNFKATKWKSNKLGEKLNVNLWAYLDKPVLKDKIDFAVNDLNNGGVNVVVVHSAFLSGQNLTDFTKLKTYLRNFKDIRNKKILLFYNFRGNAKERFNKTSFLNEKWKINFTSWYKGLLQELSGIGVNTDEIYFYPYDEIKPDEVPAFIEIAKLGKSSIPKFKTFVTIHNEKSYSVSEYADIIQITKSQLNKVQQLKNENIWVYTADNQSRDRNPYKDYRLMSWYAYYYGLKGVGFWNYCNVPSIEDAYYNKVVNGNREYSVIYLDEKKNVLSSLRWLCFQQGLYDYQLLKGYESIIGKSKIRELVKKVINNPENTSAADLALESLSNLL